MTCEHVKLPSGGVAIVCGRGPRPIKCAHCGARGRRLCDFVTEPARNHALAKTCDKGLCDACAVSVGKGIDHCPDHPKAVGAQFGLVL